MKTLDELRKMDQGKLAEELTKSQKSLFKTTFEVHNGQAKNSDAISKGRRQIAKIKTVMKEKQVEPETSTQPNQES